MTTAPLCTMGAQAFAINRNVPVIIPKNRSININRIGQNQKLSSYDIMQVNTQYCPGMDVTVKLFAHALSFDNIIYCT